MNYLRAPQLHSLGRTSRCEATDTSCSCFMGETVAGRVQWVVDATLFFFGGYSHTLVLGQPHALNCFMRRSLACYRLQFDFCARRRARMSCLECPAGCVCVCVWHETRHWGSIILRAGLGLWIGPAGGRRLETSAEPLTPKWYFKCRLCHIPEKFFNHTNGP